MPTNNVNDQLTQELEQALAKPLEKISNWEKNLFDDLAGPLSKSLVLYGAGGLGRKTLDGLRQLGITPLAFTDNNPGLYGRQVEGIPIISPEQAAHDFGDTAIFIITIFMDSAPGGIEPLVEKLNGLGCYHVASFSILYWKFPELFLPHYAYDLPHKVIASANKIQQAFDLFEDNASREEFLAQIKWRLDPSFDRIPLPVNHEIYFPPDLFSLTNNEVFIDCGAYTGDTVRSFLEHTNQQFNKIFTFEPDPANFKALTELANSLPTDISRRIQPRDLALGHRSELLHFNAQGVASSSLSNSGGTVIQCEPLDTLLKDEFPTFIKMDIEGAEIDALNGATESISRHLPKLAISAYHRQEHIWEIPLLVHSLSSAYRFHLRRYHPRVLDDLVLYAIPNQKSH